MKRDPLVVTGVFALLLFLLMISVLGRMLVFLRFISVLLLVALLAMGALIAYKMRYDKDERS